MKRKLYTEKENEFIRINWGKLPHKKIAKTLNRKLSSVRSRASKLGVTTPLYWNEKDLKYLKANYLTAPIRKLVRHFGRSAAYIVHKANELQITKFKHKDWSKKEIRLLKKLFPTKSHEELASVFNRKYDAIKRKAINLGLHRRNPEYILWAKSEEDYLIKNYPHEKWEKLEKVLGRSYEQCRNKAYTLGVYRNVKTSTFEHDFELFLNEHFGKIFSRQTKFGVYNADFYFKKFNLVIECYGDYWHCNSRMFRSPFSTFHKKAKEKNQRRQKYYKKIGVKFVYIWEQDFYKNPSKVKQQLEVLLISDG
jgi:very-short-patch-repair endonuclease